MQESLLFHHVLGLLYVYLPCWHPGDTSIALSAFQKTCLPKINERDKFKIEFIF